VPASRVSVSHPQAKQLAAGINLNDVGVVVGQARFEVFRRQMFHPSGEIILGEGDVADAGMVGELMAKPGGRHVQREAVNRCQEVLSAFGAPGAVPSDQGLLPVSSPTSRPPGRTCSSMRSTAATLSACLEPSQWLIPRVRQGRTDHQYVVPSTRAAAVAVTEEV
jgi:hypothetical protein